MFSSHQSSTTRSSASPSLSERTSSLSAAPCTFHPSDERRWARADSSLWLSLSFGYVYIKATSPSWNADGDYTPVIILFSFLIGLQSGLALSQALEGGVSTIFVCLGEDPAILAERSPALFEEIRRNYPRVVEGVPHNGV